MAFPGNLRNSSGANVYVKKNNTTFEFNTGGIMCLMEFSNDLTEEYVVSEINRTLSNLFKRRGVPHDSLSIEEALSNIKNKVKKLTDVCKK